MPSVRRKNAIVSRRRVDDEGDEDGGPDARDMDDSLSEGSVISEDDDVAEASDSSQVQAPSKTTKTAAKTTSNGRKEQVDASGASKTAGANPVPINGTSTDTDMMLNGTKESKHKGSLESANFEDMYEKPSTYLAVESPSAIKPVAHMDQPQETPIERRRREHEDYKKKRDADPAFVPNRGAFFMHDHRHAGPAANGFRPFGRGRGRGRGGIGGPFGPPHHMQSMNEPTDAPWTHDMHEAVLEPDNPNVRAPPNQYLGVHSSARGVPQAPRGPTPNRSLSSEKHVGNVQLRVFLPDMKAPLTFPGVPLIQYTRLPDHRPPLRRDKPVRISLPDHNPRYIFPSIERSFIFIPRAMRPNQQGFGPRNRGRPGFGSIGGYSRQTSMYGGSVYGSVYSPSVAMSRRSSLAIEVPRDSLISPTGSNMSRPPMPAERPIVRLPPASQPPPLQELQVPVNGHQTTSLSAQESPQPHNYPLPQDPTFRENRPNSIPMHQPRPQKTVSVAGIESPAAMSFNPPQQYQQPFHQQVPAEVNANGYSHDAHLHPHSRNASYPSQTSTGTPLSQIPERAIHAQPFQPNPYQQQQSYYPQYTTMPQQSGYYYPQQFTHAMAPPAQSFVTGAPPQQTYNQPTSHDPAAGQQGGQAGLVAQEVNGMVYYYDASQLPVASFPAFPAAPAFPLQQVGGMAYGMMTPSPDVFYPQNQQGVVYYGQ